MAKKETADDATWAVMGGDGFAPMKDATLSFVVNFDDEDEARPAEPAR